jgi:Tol biopolymer transport system component
MNSLVFSLIAAAVLVGSGARSAGHARPERGERVWSPPNSHEVYDVSPDGKLVGYIDWDTGNLMVHDLATGANRDLTKKGTYAQSRDEAESVLFSRDGKRIAYEWWDGKARVDEVRTIGTDGSGVKTVYRARPEESVWPTDWTPDGSAIVTIINDDKRRNITLVPATGGTPRIIKSFDVNNRQLVAVISPDGRYIAATVHAADMRRDIVILAVADGREIGVIRHAEDEVPIRWLTDAVLLFQSSRGGSPGIWRQQVNAGRPQGEPRLVRGDLWSLDDAHITADGRVFYCVNAGDRDVFTVNFNPATGRATSQAVSVSRKPGEDYSGPQFSPDGKYVAFLKRERNGVGFVKILIRSLASDEVREFTPKVFSPGGLRWMPGSQALALSAADRDNRPKVYRFDLRTGEATEIVSGSNSPVAFSPDGRTVYYSSLRMFPTVPLDDSTPSRVFARDLVTGRERVLYAPPRDRWAQPLALSNDGKTLAAAWIAKTPSGRVPVGAVAISTETGAIRHLSSNVPSDSMMQGVRAMGFTPDQRSQIIIGHAKDSAKTMSLWRVPLAGGSPVALGPAPRAIEYNGRQAAGSWLSPDATRLVYVAGEIRQELWLLDEPELRLELASRK